MIIEATFIGKNSLGYKNGERYKLKITQTFNRICIKRIDNTGDCDYSHIGTFLENWSDIENFTIKIPPLGLKPKWLHDEQRNGEVVGAIRRYLKARKEIPNEWIEEYQEYCRKQKDVIEKIDNILESSSTPVNPDTFQGIFSKEDNSIDVGFDDPIVIGAKKEQEVLEEKVYWLCNKDLYMLNGDEDLRFKKGKKYEQVNRGNGNLIFIDEKGINHAIGIIEGLPTKLDWKQFFTKINNENKIEEAIEELRQYQKFGEIPSIKAIELILNILTSKR